MAAVTGLTLVKKFTYHGNPNEEWSNTYHLRNAPPSNDASWLQLATDLIGHEKAVYPSTVKVVRALGYNDDAENAQSVWNYDWEVQGTPIAGIFPLTGNHFAGDQAAMVWWRSSKKNSRGKWIYLRKYFHAGEADPTTPDNLTNAYHDALETLANALSPNAGAFWGGVRARAWTDNITAQGASGFTTTRTLKRRGKRPLPRP